MRALRILLILLVGGGLGLLAVPLLPRQAQEWVATRQSDVSSLVDDARAPLAPTATPGLTPTATRAPVVLRDQEPRTATPAPTATATSAPIVLREQLPRTVYQKFHNDWYASGCVEPPLEHLGIARQWSGTEPGQVDLSVPRDTYFLVVQVSPNSTEWSFNSVYRAGGRRWESLRLSSAVPEDLAAAQKWCSSWAMVQPVNQLQIDATGVEWTLSLVKEGGRIPISTELRMVEALTGYYGVGPPDPPEESLRVVESWSSGEFGATTDIEYTTLVPFTYLLLSFDSNAKEWWFDSVDRSGDWTSQGPAVSSASGRTMDTTSLCPESHSLHTLEVESSGGDWTIWLVGVPAEP